MIFLSLKTYKQASGDAVLGLLSDVKKISEETKVPIIACVQATDIYRIKKDLDIEVWAQHIDPIDPGRNTGWISPFSVKQAGATGVIINHAEHLVNEEIIKTTIEKAKQYNLKTLVLCQSLELAQKVSTWNPNYIGYEKAELIAGPVSMIDEEEENIKLLAKKITQPLIIGAGISTSEHIIKSLKAGAQGVILASAFTKASDPAAKLRELASAFRNPSVTPGVKKHISTS